MVVGNCGFNWYSTTTVRLSQSCWLDFLFRHCLLWFLCEMINNSSLAWRNCKLWPTLEKSNLKNVQPGELDLPVVLLCTGQMMAKLCVSQAVKHLDVHSGNKSSSLFVILNIISSTGWWKDAGSLKHPWFCSTYSMERKNISIPLLSNTSYFASFSQIFGWKIL